MMTENFSFDDLFVFEMANNHQGDVEHGIRIIREVAKLAKEFKIKGAVKLQFRNLDTFIHRDYRNDTKNKHISRFLSTQLSREQFKRLAQEIQQQGLISMCTPFDEESVQLIEDLGIEILKIGSCSALDWPLLERAVDANLPMIISTGGLSIPDIDKIVSFCNHRGVEFALMHCVSIYPTAPEHCQLNQIEAMKNRYPKITIGWSTHEAPTEGDAIKVALAKGARMFERHVGIETDKIKLNTYSSTPEQLRAWLQAYFKGKALLGSEQRPKNEEVEIESLNSLRRGVYLKEAVQAEQEITRENVYFAMPYHEGQLFSGIWKNNIIAKRAIAPHEAVMLESIQMPEDDKVSILQTALHEIKAMLNECRIPLNSNFNVEYSHHYGIENFRKVGAVLIDLVNRSYCKKIIIQLPHQKHPTHFHKRKEETFSVLFGTLHVEVDGHHRVLHPGETLLVQPGTWHSFWTETGTIFEEISTTHFNDDSFYKDKRINKMARSERKTVVDHWGRFLLKDKAAVPSQGQVAEDREPKVSSPGKRAYESHKAKTAAAESKAAVKRTVQ